MTPPRRLYLPPDRWEGATAVCEGDVAHRIRSVLRLRAGDRLRVFDGRGREREARLESIDRRRVELVLLADVAALAEPTVPVVLACAFPRGGRGDWLVEKATELGAARIVPLDAGRAVLDPGEGRLERWRRVAVEAAEQCGRAVVPPIGGEPPPNALRLVADPRAERPLRAALSGASAPAIALYIGPEGGWSDAERAAFASDGALEVSLGTRTLRVETAALAGLALIMEMTASPSGTA